MSTKTPKMELVRSSVSSYKYICGELTLKIVSSAHTIINSRSSFSAYELSELNELSNLMEVQYG